MRISKFGMGGWGKKVKGVVDVTIFERQKEDFLRKEVNDE
ncbi:hypothetical protein A5880_001528 [Enterococcus sp. 4G2_DIV0659]|uniref:Uncharacterized protein n=1 Tax=Candidatus Enterococcus mansonii TaxID=1834181 RepID=A0A242CDY0_9ENTE|nr:hypothetical protein A5880_001447 [Enterococcus sp. 4G2_DIV0659]